MSENGLIKPPEITKNPALMCHRIYAPIVIPEPDALNPKRLNVIPRFGNFACCKDKCTLWNKDKSECYDVTQSKAMSVIAEYAFNKMNDVSIPEAQ